MKLTLLTYVRSEEDDLFGQTPLGIYLLYYLLWGIFPCFLLLRRIVIKKWDFKPNAKAQVLAPTPTSTFSASNKLLLLRWFKFLLLLTNFLQNMITLLLILKFLQSTKLTPRIHFFFFFNFITMYLFLLSPFFCNFFFKFHYFNLTF